MKIEKVDALNHIKNNRRMYLAYEHAHGFELASKLAIDALSTGTKSIEIQQNEHWWIISSPEDWIAINPEGYSVDQLFSRICPNPSAGPNAMRNEILLAAFADNVVVFSSDNDCDAAIRRIQGTREFTSSIITERNVFGIAFTIPS